MFMTKPLALVYYERLLPGSQLVNRLQDLGYRVQTIAEAALLIQTARKEGPLVVLVDLVTQKANICAIIKDMKQDGDTGHIPIIGFAGQSNKKLHTEAVKCGASLVAFDDAVLPQLPHLLEQALVVE
jgi:DNA-binding NtrC family response regulator